MLMLMRDSEALKLANKLVSLHHMHPEPEVDQVKDHELMIHAFIKLAELDPEVIRSNQYLLRRYLYPAMTQVRRLPIF